VKGVRKIFIPLVLALALAGFRAGPVDAADRKEPWRPAEGNWKWSFPADHGSHPEFQTEWWYFTGNLVSPSGRAFGYQLTFFRAALEKTPLYPENPWSVRDLYLAHFALTDVSGGGFFWKERVSRTGPGLAGAAGEGLDVHLLDWKAVQMGGTINLAARSDEMGLNLSLTPRKPPVLHGREGLSLKGPNPGQASFYYSLTDLAAEGVIDLPGENATPVSGRSWFDHEFGSNQLAPDQAGWDWFGLHLSDGRELMIYLMRKKDGKVEDVSSGTLVHPDGSFTHLSLDDFIVTARDFWKSPASEGRYPSGWEVLVPGQEIRIRVTPLVKDQEMITEAAARITYWEGAVAIEGRSGGRDVTGGGYVELTGYAGSIGGKF